MRKIAPALLLVLLSATLSFAQSSPKEASPAVDRDNVIRTLLQRVDDKDALLASLEKREKDLQDEIASAKQAHTDLTEAHEKRLLELGEVRASLKYEREAKEALKEQVELWRNESKRLNKELSASRKRELFLLLGHIVRSVIGR